MPDQERLKKSGLVALFCSVGAMLLLPGCPMLVTPDPSPPSLVPCDGDRCAEGMTCVEGLCVADEPEAFKNADATRGGSMYDKWWVVVELDEPTGDHPLWATRPDTDSNTRTGKDTWRCKECHGWDYKGVDGAYGGGSHKTGFDGIAGTTLSAQGVFDSIKTAHGFGDAGLSDADIWDLAKFVLEGVIDTDSMIDADNAFIGNADAGQTLYDDGTRGNLACTMCHGADGTDLNFKEPPDEEFLGDLARGNPWEFQHKVRFGQPGSSMPVGEDVDTTNDEVAAIGAYTQTLAP
ncbi:MAG: c-type cytochrome [Phycisphaerae bacterium]